MYRYVADQIKSGAIAVSGGAASDQYYWFDQAARINSGDVSSSASVFIRAATKYGLAADNQPTTDSNIQKISDDIGAKVFADLSKGNLPPFSQQLAQDIGAAIRTGHMTIGGWGGAFYFWNEPYTTPQGTVTTVGGAILASDTERAKFLEVNKMAIADTFNKFGTDLFSDPSFGTALAGGLKSFGPGASLSENLLGLQLMGEASLEVGRRYGQEAVRQLEDAIIKEMGLRPSFSQTGDPGIGVSDAASSLFEEDVYGGGIDSDSQQLADGVKAKLDQLLQGKDTDGAVVYEIPGVQTWEGQLGAGGVVIKLKSGESITIDSAGRTAYRFQQPSSDGGDIWTYKEFSGQYTTTQRQTSASGLFLSQTETSYDAQNTALQTTITQRQSDNSLQVTVRQGIDGPVQGSTNIQTFDDGSRLETTTLANGQVVQKSLDSEGQLAGTITDTPDGHGGLNRTISTVVDGKTLYVEQHIDASKLAEDTDHDGDFVDAGDADTTSVTIDGQAADNSDAIEGAIDAGYQDGEALIAARDSGSLRQLVTAGDASNATGWRDYLPKLGPTSYATEADWAKGVAGQLGQYTQTLSSTQALITALKTGDNTAIAVNTFSLVAVTSGQSTAQLLGSTFGENSLLTQANTPMGGLPGGTPLAFLSLVNDLVQRSPIAVVRHCGVAASNDNFWRNAA
jgi:hypothetical protein